jgi:hypothetical protein
LTHEDYKLIYHALAAYGFATEVMINRSTVEATVDQLDAIKAVITKVGKLRAYSSESEQHQLAADDSETARGQEGYHD